MRFHDNRLVQDHTRVCVIIPNFNYARYLTESIESVLNQSHQHLDLIIVDDGSTDDSVRVAERKLAEANGERRASLFNRKENTGKLAALNSIQEHITAPFMLTLDADDQLEPHYIETCLRRLLGLREESPRTGFVYTDCRLMDENGRVLDRGRSTSFDPEKLRTLSYIPEPALCLSEAFLEVMPFDISIKVGTKHHKWLRMVENGWAGHHIPEPLFRYRMHSANLSGIGSRVLGEIDSGQSGERILSGYWSTSHH